MWTVPSAPGSASFSSGSAGDVGILTCSSAEAVVISLLPWGQEGCTSRQQRVPADSSQGLSPAPCLSVAQKDRCQLFPACCEALQGACFSAAEAGALAGSLLAAGGSREARVLKCSSGETNRRPCCCFLDNCPHCAAGRLQGPARCLETSPCLSRDIDLLEGDR